MRRVVGTVEQTPRWKECTTVLSSAMPYATDAMFIRKYFKQSDFKLAEEMFGKLKNEFIKKLMQTRWMDRVTRSYALEKAKKMVGLIGAPNFIYNDEELDTYYKNLNWLPNDSYATIVEKHSLWRQKTSSLNLLKPVDLSLFPMSSTTVNAAYTFVRNALTIPGAILQMPFFNAEFPM
jgi:putative endopeptidase